MLDGRTYTVWFERRVIVDALFSFDDLSDVLSEFNGSNAGKSEEILSGVMSEEMAASKRRYEEYIKKHEEQ